MKNLAIVVGDITDHGGSVLSGAKTFLISNIPIAHVGCEVICPLHGLTHIVSGQNHFLIEGKPAAIEGDLTSCGARLVSRQQSSFWIGGQSPPLSVVTYPAPHSRPPAAIALTHPQQAQPATTTRIESGDIHCDERFQFFSTQRTPLGHLNYALLQDGRCIAQGVLDREGRSQTHGSTNPAVLHIAISAPSPVLE